VDFMHYYVPFPNLFALADNLRFYKEIGVEGIYLQAMGHAGGGGEFSLLRPYFAMRLAWDPELDPGELIDEFLDGYYGAASAPIRDWIDRIQAKVEDEGIHMHLYTNPAQGYLPDEVVEAGELLLDEAAALVAGDPVLEDRVAVARMPLMYARFFPRNGYRIEDGMLRWNPGMATAEDVVAFTDMMSSHGFQTVREVQGGPETMMMLWAIIGSDKPIVTIRNDALEADVVPALAGRALRITHRVTGKTVTAFDKRPNLFFPFTGGYEDRIGTAFDAMGWVEPASPSAATERSVTVTMTTFDGWKVSRAYELDAAEPVLRVATTVTNTGDAARDLTGVRTHRELDLGGGAATPKRVTARGGATVDDDMAGVIAGQREGRRFREQDAPAGEWTFSGTKGLSVTQSFDDASVDSAWVYAYPATLGEVEVEVWSPRTTLPPGGSVTVERALRVEAE
jgi:hypothetical protein